MIEYKEARKIIVDNAPGPKGVEEVPLASAAGRVLARPAHARLDLPPFDKSAMDGFAVRAADVASTPAALDVVLDVPAGSVPDRPIGPGQAASVMTGAPVPEGADSVVQVEWTSGFGSDTVTINEGVEPGKNVSPRGEIIRAGDVALEPGSFVCVEETSLLASAGCDPVPVFQVPTAAVLSTGDEVVAPASDAGPGQIFDSNGPALCAFLRSIGIDPVMLDPAADDPESLRPAIEKGLEHDLLLVTGGVSAGAYDFVEDVLAELGVTVHTRRIAIKPGKPTVFGIRDDKMIFGLPGNPVSAMVVAQLLVEPALAVRRGLGRRRPSTISARLTEALRKKPDRLWFAPGRLGFDPEPTVTPLSPRGSADLPTAVEADCLLMAPRGVDRLEAGTQVEVVVWSRSVVASFERKAE